MLVNDITQAVSFVDGGSSKTVTRSFSQATGGRLLTDWTTYGLNINRSIYNDLSTLQNRSLDLAKTDALISSVRKKLRTGIIGADGIVHTWLPKRRDGSLDTRAQALIQASWDDFITPQHCSVNEKFSYRKMCEFGLVTKFILGEAFAHMRYSRQAKYFLQLQYIPVSKLDTKLYREKANGNRIIMGIEFTREGKPVNYYFIDRWGPTIDYSEHYAPKYVIIPAEQILHLADFMTYEQARGFPEITPAMLKLRHLDKYTEASVIGARADAVRGGFYEQSEDVAYDGVEQGQIVDYLEPNQWTLLPKGLKASPYAPTRPDNKFSEFFKAIARIVTSSIGQNYNTIVGDYEAMNFNSLRMANLQQWQENEYTREDFEEQLSRPFASEWLKVNLANGTWPTLQYSEVGRLNHVNTEPKGLPLVQPKQEIDTYINMIENELASKQFVQRRLGLNPSRMQQEIEQERANAGSNETD